MGPQHRGVFHRRLVMHFSRFTWRPLQIAVARGFAGEPVRFPGCRTIECWTFGRSGRSCPAEVPVHGESDRWHPEGRRGGGPDRGPGAEARHQPRDVFQLAVEVRGHERDRAQAAEGTRGGEREAETDVCRARAGERRHEESDHAQDEERDQAGGDEKGTWRGAEITPIRKHRVPLWRRR